jgi:hypothetical protein
MPDFRVLWQPAEAFGALVAATDPAHQSYWTGFLVAKQRDIIATAAATAVGINMTFLFPYSILRRGWGREFAGLMRFDLATGMLIPFTLATSFVVIAAATQFNGVPQAGLLRSAEPAAHFTPASPGQVREFEGLLTNLERSVAASGATAVIAAADRQLAATLVNRDAFHLAAALAPLTGPFFGNVIFGLGVLGMTLSTITILMLISGQVACAIFKTDQTGWTFRLGSLAAATGALGPFIWSQAAFYLAVPTSVFALILLPIAYLAFFLLFNQRQLLGDARPRGASLVAWNVLMGGTLVIVIGASGFMLIEKGGPGGIIAAALFMVGVLVTHFLRSKPTV